MIHLTIVTFQHDAPSHMTKGKRHARCMDEVPLSCKIQAIQGCSSGGRGRETLIRSVLEDDKAPKSVAAGALSYVSSSLSYVASTTPGIATISVMATLAASGLYWRYFRRIRNAEYLTPGVLRWRRVLVGRCTSVGDGDGFRLYHQPGLPFIRDYLYPIPTTPTALRNSTLSVRLAGADAPEAAHFGNPAQPYAKEALEYLKTLVLKRTVWLEVAHVDQYKRLVATPYVWNAPYIFGRTNVSLRMIKEGLAVVYRSGGASYGSATWWHRLFFKVSTGEARLERAEEKARRLKKGIWSQKQFESPNDYKKRVRGADHGKLT
ncbi:SNase-domain-containing protein [Tilletiaria anomala UBC 951]|uniref:SNase-domain-containing protein n=1 Tax=Tilletiaria anomala (strain ATCC 24038 / CBS 436.72 / UBC 951) TaxID=1037660 RepID=A0A066VPG3_TILAU|nr:SNase-domain-containing protein [Tilletiaria anomala UBC 951]KDN42183.1 SNase-domain-containing protein [Tilletiaria anomala UBC 951]